MGEVIPAKKEESIEIPEIKPGKNYVWTPEDKFVLTGEEFSQVINGLRASAQIIETLFQQGIEAGVIKEQAEVPTPIKDDKIIDAVPLP